MRHEVKVLRGYFLLGDSYKEFCGYITQHMQHWFTDLGLLSYHNTLFINAKNNVLLLFNIIRKILLAFVILHGIKDS